MNLVKSIKTFAPLTPQPLKPNSDCKYQLGVGLPLKPGQLTKVLGIPLHQLKHTPDEMTMSAASRYWTLVRIDASGKRHIEPLASAKAFFFTSFPELTTQSRVPDVLIQRQLLHWMREVAERDLDARLQLGQEVTGTQPEHDKTSRSFLAELCLRCLISSQIDRVCQRLATQFGLEHGFNSSDLLSLVLDNDSIRPSRNTIAPNSTSYQSLISEILQSFDPEQSSLVSWTTRLVKHHREVNAFLLERGVYLVSDWAILNDTNSKQIQRIFSEFHQLTPFEITQASQLLESYHAVYRAQRLQQRQAGITGRCLPPTTEQLKEMAQRLATQTAHIYRPENIMAKLQAIASRLRQYRIYVRGGTLPTESIDTPIPSETSERIKFRDFGDNRNTTDEQTEFLSFYRQQVLFSLDQAIAKVTQEYVRRLKCEDPTKAQNFVTALQLFHTEGLSMAAIAKRLNLKAQFQVTRLLKLKAFRADVQREFLRLLCDRVIHKAKAYIDSEYLQAYSAKIAAALEEQVSAVIQEAATEASTPNCAKTSIFAERVCFYLASATNTVQ